MDEKVNKKPLSICLIIFVLCLILSMTLFSIDFTPKSFITLENFEVNNNDGTYSFSGILKNTSNSEAALCGASLYFDIVRLGTTMNEEYTPISGYALFSADGGSITLQGGESYDLSTETNINSNFFDGATSYTLNCLTLSVDDEYTIVYSAYVVLQEWQEIVCMCLFAVAVVVLIMAIFMHLAEKRKAKRNVGINKFIQQNLEGAVFAEGVLTEEGDGKKAVKKTALSILRGLFMALFLGVGVYGIYLKGTRIYAFITEKGIYFCEAKNQTDFSIEEMYFISAENLKDAQIINLRRGQKLKLQDGTEISFVSKYRSCDNETLYKNLENYVNAEVKNA